MSQLIIVTGPPCSGKSTLAGQLTEKLGALVLDDAEIAVEVLARFQHAHLGEVVRIDTAQPWGIQSVEGETRFDVFPALLKEL